MHICTNINTSNDFSEYTHNFWGNRQKCSAINVIDKKSVLLSGRHPNGFLCDFGLLSKLILVPLL